MTTHQRLSKVIERQQRHRVLDMLVALVFIIGLGVSSVAMALQMPGAQEDPAALLHSDYSQSSQSVDSADPNAYTAQLLADTPDHR